MERGSYSRRVQNSLTPTLSHAEETRGRGRDLCVDAWVASGSHCTLGFKLHDIHKPTIRRQQFR
jgi:hypothetical protein